MADIYEMHEKAFAHVSAFVIMRDGKRVATIAFKFPRDGAGRLYAYVHWLGEPMVRGHASGYGYDKRSAACSDAARKLTPPEDDATQAATERVTAWLAFRDNLRRDDGSTWERALERAGFTVWQAV